MDQKNPHIQLRMIGRLRYYENTICHTNLREYNSVFLYLIQLVFKFFKFYYILKHLLSIIYYLSIDRSIYYLDR